MQAADAEPRERPAMHYVATARMMAECVGSALAEDFADASIKEALAAGLPASGTKPFSAGGGEGWAEFTVTPAHRALALRVQGRAQARAFLAIRRATPGVGGALRRVMPRAPRAAGTSRRQWARWQNMCRRRASKWKRRRKAIICPSRSRPLLSRWRDRIRGGARLRRAQERIKEVGLDVFPGEALPTEEAMLRFERLAKVSPAECAPGARGVACAA